MPITPWNWLWTVTTAVLLGRAHRQPQGRVLLQPFAWCSAVAAAVAWAGITGPWHLLLFPVFPLLYVAAVQMRLPAPPQQVAAPGVITVAYGRNRWPSSERPARRRKERRQLVPNPMPGSTVAWAPTAVAAILLVLAGVDEPWVIAPVFPLAPVLAAGVWRRLDRFKVFADADVRLLATVVALEVTLGVVALTVPEAVPPVFDTAATSGRPADRPDGATTTTLPAVLAEGTGSMLVEVVGSVAQFDGTTDIIPVEAAFVTITPVVGPARFALTDIAGRASFVVDPGIYTVAVVPPGNRWSVMRGCGDLLDDFAVAAGEAWQWQVPMVDDPAALAYGAVTRCNDVRLPVLVGAGG